MRLVGAMNFRDLGGLPAADGRALRHGLLFRSEKLSTLTDADVTILGRLGLQTVIDLRSGQERDIHPSRLPQQDRPAVLELDVMAHPTLSGRSLVGVLRENPTTAGARQMMLALYRAFPTAFAPVLPALFGRLLAEGGLPALIHCTAGKDRTGFLAALLLSAAGASRAAVEADYMATGTQSDHVEMHAATTRAVSHWLGDRATVEVVDVLCEVDPSYLAASFEAIEAGWGGVARYLAAEAGVDAAGLAGLRKRLLD